MLTFGTGATSTNYQSTDAGVPGSDVLAAYDTASRDPLTVVVR